MNPEKVERPYPWPPPPIQAAGPSATGLNLPPKVGKLGWRYRLARWFDPELDEKYREEAYALLYSQLYMDLVQQLERKIEDEMKKLGKIPAKSGRRKIGKQKRLKLRRRRAQREKHK